LKARNSEDLYDVVKVIAWLGGEVEEERGYEVLAKVVEMIEEEGGVYATMRRYHNSVAMSQEVDCLKEQ
jgi:hypothetical protein